MLRTIRWTHPSVIAFAQGLDPVEAITNRARDVAMEAMGRGWSGPPFDPIALAEILGIETLAREDVRDARTVPNAEGSPQIEYNPTRPRGRVRYSLAHEIAHTLFPDWAEQVRHRAQPQELKGDDWQLEALCNIAAAEFVMPVGSFTMLAESPLGIDRLLGEQGRYDVSMEALLIRTVRLRLEECAMFCASPVAKGTNAGRLRVDYLIGSRAWAMGVGLRGMILPAETGVARCSAIGFTAKGTEAWAGTPLRIEAVGIAPYPGSSLPRVVGLLQPDAESAEVARTAIEYLFGDATQPQAAGQRIIAQVVTDGATTWGGGGFAAAVRRAWPHAQQEFRQWVGADRRKLSLGNVHFSSVQNGVRVASIVAQHGYGPSPHPRIRYNALRDGLAAIAQAASESGASVHMPRIGCGMAGGSWDVVEELIWLTLGRAGVTATVYDPPGKRNLGQPSLFSSVSRQ